MMSPEQKELFRKVQVYGFLIEDVKLFLDTHPTDMSAINYFKKYQHLYNMAVDEYAQKYTPITVASANIKNRWTWVDKPWPWQMEE